MTQIIDVPTITEQFTDACLLEVEVGTNGFHGGDSGRGGKTIIRIKDIGGTDMEVTTTEGEVTLIFGGDGELRNIKKALRFMSDILEVLSQPTWRG